MFGDARTLSEAINYLRYEKGNISFQKYAQLTKEQGDNEARLSYIRLSSLNSSEVKHTLCLEPAKTDQKWGSIPTITPPEFLIKSLEIIDSALDNETNAGASIRWRMNNFILCAMNTAMDSCSEQEELPQLNFEPRWSFGPVQHQDQPVQLSGYPSYALCYGDKDEADVNVILAQSQRFKRDDAGISEVLGYMGFVYHHRKDANKANPPIYGIATDSKIFHFVRLDNDSTFLTTRVDSGLDIEQVFSYLVHIFKAAMIDQPIQPEEPSTQPSQGERSEESLVPVGSSLRRKIAKGVEYEKLKLAAIDMDKDVDYYDLDVRDFELQYPDDQSSEDESVVSEHG
ncbi:unnamed protein product [Penicillium olsonii]|nr:unnamed protein product [Penicillium olsonii]CAG7934107.1 unnamed protein product [Penicillium olsonii]